MAGSYVLTAQNVTDVSVEILVTDDASSALPIEGETVSMTGGISSAVTNSQGIASFSGLTPSTAYTASVTGGSTFSVTFSTKSTGYDDPRTATQEQWEDLATKIKAKADSSDVPSTYWGQTANNGAVSGMLSFGTNGYVNGTNTTVTIYADNSGGADPFSFSHSGFDVADKKITSLANGTASHDAVNKSQLDAKPTITMTSTDPGEGSALTANNYVAVYGGDPIIMDYSTTEINTGAKWIDGSTIYKKTVNFGALPNNTTKTVAHNISNLGRIVKVEQSTTNGGTGALILSSGNQSGIDEFNLYVTNTNIGIWCSTDRSASDSYVTLYYTKSSS